MMIKLLLSIMLAITLTGCASVFETKAEWPDEAYGGPLEKVALEGFREHHSRWLTAPRTAPQGYNVGTSTFEMHAYPEPTASCVTHSIWTAEQLEERGLEYELVLLKVNPGLWHSVIKVGDRVLDINTREPYPYADYQGRYLAERNLGKVKSKNIGGVVTALGYTYKK